MSSKSRLIAALVLTGVLAGCSGGAPADAPSPAKSSAAAEASTPSAAAEPVQAAAAFDPAMCESMASGMVAPLASFLGDSVEVHALADPAAEGFSTVIPAPSCAMRASGSTGTVDVGIYGDSTDAQFDAISGAIAGTGAEPQDLGMDATPGVLRSAGYSSGSDIWGIQMMDLEQLGLPMMTGAMTITMFIPNALG